MGTPDIEKGSSICTAVEAALSPPTMGQKSHIVQRQRKSKAQLAGCILLASLLFAFFRLLGGQTYFAAWRHCRTELHTGPWKSCGEQFDGFECANFTVPLDYHNASDTRTMSIAVTRMLATDQANRKGAVFINPGGPGGSGTSMAFTRGPLFDKMLKGQYDIIGFDPRGINNTRPYVSCFPSQLDADVYTLLKGRLNLPANATLLASDSVQDDLRRQVEAVAASTASLATKCRERTGEEIAFLGTEAVVRDIDFLAKHIEGEDKPINYWGISYGTVIGQYLVQILPPERIGRVMIDGVVNVDVWADYPIVTFHEGLDDIDAVLASFASSCVAAGSTCALAHLGTPRAVLRSIDALIDRLYAAPQPVHALPTPAVASAASVRQLLFRGMYRVAAWPEMAAQLDAALKGDYAGLVNATVHKIDKEGARKPDDSRMATYPIWCADTKAYTPARPAPSNAAIATATRETLARYSYRMGDGFFDMAFCHLWDAHAGIAPRRMRYAGPFGLSDGTLQTPVLVLSNTYDPVTSLASARAANARLGSNARLVQQTDGWGHATLSQVSFCTAKIVREYMVDGALPAEKHTLCAVDQLPWREWNQTMPALSGDEADEEEIEMRRAWMGLVEAHNAEM